MCVQINDLVLPKGVQTFALNDLECISVQEFAYTFYVCNVHITSAVTVIISLQ